MHLDDALPCEDPVVAGWQSVHFELAFLIERGGSVQIVLAVFVAFVTFALLAFDFFVLCFVAAAVVVSWLFIMVPPFR